MSTKTLRPIPSVVIRIDEPLSIRQIHTSAVLRLEAAAEAYAARRGKGGDEQDALLSLQIAACQFAGAEALIARVK